MAVGKAGGVKKAKVHTKKKVMGKKDPDAVDAARQFLPEGASLHMETEWHTRWRVEYPDPVLPFTTSCSFDEESHQSKRDALLFCLRFAWECHTHATGEACPFDLSK